MKGSKEIGKCVCKKTNQGTRKESVQDKQQGTRQEGTRQESM